MTDPTFTPDDFDRIRKEAERLYRDSDSIMVMSRLILARNILMECISFKDLDCQRDYFALDEKGKYQLTVHALNERIIRMEDEIRKTGDGTIKVS